MALNTNTASQRFVIESEDLYLRNLSTYISLYDGCLARFANLQYFPLASFTRSYRVTDEAL